MCSGVYRRIESSSPFTPPNKNIPNIPRSINHSHLHSSITPNKMCSSHHLPSAADPLRRFSFPRPSPSPPHSVSFRPAAPRLRSALTDHQPPAAAATFYDLLGIPATGSLLEIKQAYKQLARKYHPDVSPPGRLEEYTERFIRVQEAYETLSDPGLRELYDRHVSTGLHLAFTARRRTRFDEENEDRCEWKNRWQSQLSELKRRSAQKESGDNMSWGARMRRERNGSA